MVTTWTVLLSFVGVWAKVQMMNAGPGLRGGGAEASVEEQAERV